jgi:hypothetical protein
MVRILHAVGREGTTPFFSANDRSRWCTLAALVENGTYQIDGIYDLSDSNGRRPWFTIDRVQHRGHDGFQHSYSSKPPLLPTLYAGVYWLIHQATGLKLTERPFLVGQIILILVNLVPLAIFWWFASQEICRHSRYFANTLLLTAFTVFGTFLFTFGNTLNNHLPAAIAVGVTLLTYQRMTRPTTENTKKLRWPALAGFAGAFAVSCELPALGWLGLLGLIVMWTQPMKSWFAFALGGLPVLVLFFATNYAAHQTWRPAYSQRSAGALLLEINQPLPPLTVENLAETLGRAAIPISPSAILRPAQRSDYLELWDPDSQQRFAIIAAGETIEIRQWGDWYDYPGTYWTDRRVRGVDRGESSRLVYALNMLIGHHGILSLTPFWSIALLGIYRGLRSGSTDVRRMLLAISVITLVCLAFYILRPLNDRNYGGVTSGLRWSFWLIPLWLYLCVLGLREVRLNAWQIGAVSVLLAMSVVSSMTAWNNPWTHPWIFRWWESAGWIDYNSLSVARLFH